jgi:hypothetical protein
VLSQRRRRQLGAVRPAHVQVHDPTSHRHSDGNPGSNVPVKCPVKGCNKTYWLYNFGKHWTKHHTREKMEKYNYGGKTTLDSYVKVDATELAFFTRNKKKRVRDTGKGKGKGKAKKKSK